MRIGKAQGVEVVRERDAALIREARLKVARNNRYWVELEAVDLVRRGPGWLVSATTDEVFTAYRSVVWESGTASIAFQAGVPMWFYADDNGDVEFLERGPRKWSEITAQKARRKVSA